MDQSATTTSEKTNSFVRRLKLDKLATFVSYTNKATTTSEKTNSFVRRLKLDKLATFVSYIRTKASSIRVVKENVSIIENSKYRNGGKYTLEKSPDAHALARMIDNMSEIKEDNETELQKALKNIRARLEERALMERQRQTVELEIDQTANYKQADHYYGQRVPSLKSLARDKISNVNHEMMRLAV